MSTVLLIFDTIDKRTLIWRSFSFPASSTSAIVASGGLQFVVAVRAVFLHRTFLQQCSKSTRGWRNVRLWCATSSLLLQPRPYMVSVFCAYLYLDGTFEPSVLICTKIGLCCRGWHGGRDLSSWISSVAFLGCLNGLIWYVGPDGGCLLCISTMVIWSLVGNHFILWTEARNQ